MRRSVITALLAAALSFAGCGGGDESASASDVAAEFGKIDACAMLTADEIEAATGIAPGAPEKAGPSGGVPACNWPSADGSDPAFLTLLIAPSDNYGSFEAAMVKWQESAEGMGMEFDPAEYQEVDGAGDVNAWLREAGMLQAHRGSKMVQVYATRFAPDHDPLEASKALAGHALERLP